MKYFFLFCCLVLSQTYHSQSDTSGVKPPFFNQVNISMNYSDVNRYTGNKNQGSYGIGIYQNNKWQKPWRMQWGFELVNIRQKEKYQFSNSNTFNMEVQSSIHSINIPFNFQYIIGDRIKWIPEAGVYMEHCFGHRESGRYIREITDSSGTSYLTQEYDKKGRINPFNVGVSAGIGVQIPSGKYSYILKADYRYGIGDLALDNTFGALYTRYFRLSAGIIFHEKQVRVRKELADKIVLRPNKPSAEKDSLYTPYFNEYTLSVNYNDISRYTLSSDRVGFGFGVYHNSKIRRGFSSTWGMELNETRYRGRLVASHNHGMYRYSDMDAAITFLTLPASLKYHIGKRLCIVPEIGLYFDINLNARGKGMHYYYEETGGDPPYRYVEEEVFITDASIRRLNYGATTGLGFLIPVGKNNILLKAEYRYGIRDIGTYYNYNEIYNRYLRFALGYSFGTRRITKGHNDDFFFNEYRLSMNHSFLKNQYSRSMYNNAELKGLPGFGFGIFHNTKEKRHFQYQFGFELNMFNQQKYFEYASDSVSNYFNQTQLQNYSLSVPNALRYYITNTQVRPFVQLGFSPRINLYERINRLSGFKDKADNELLSSANRIDNEFEPQLKIEFHGGIGCAIRRKSLEYLLLAEYYVGQLDYSSNFYIYDGPYRTQFFKFSIGVRIHSSK